MVFRAAEAVMDVPVDVAKNICAAQQSSQRMGSHMVSRENPVDIPIGRRVRDEYRGFIEDWFNVAKVGSDLVLRLLVTSPDEWRAVLVSGDAAGTEMLAPAMDGLDPFVLMAEVHMIVVTHDVTHGQRNRPEQRSDNRASLFGRLILPSADQQVACKDEQIRAVFRRSFPQPFVYSYGAVNVRNRQNAQSSLLSYPRLKPRPLAVRP